MRKTERPSLKGCPGSWHSPPGLFRYHDWEWGTMWNGNNSKVLPFWKGTKSIARSGWYCKKCSKFAWDQSDIEFALLFAYAIGLIKLPTKEKVHEHDSSSCHFA